jgi:tetratricopeptide (TPR) repeat protein
MANDESGAAEKPAPDGLDSGSGSKLRFGRFGVFALGPQATNFFQSLYSFFTKLPWIAAIVVVAAILIRGLTEHVTVIHALSVPETLQTKGFTPEVAGHRLRDALADYVRSAKTHMRSPDIALHDELPDIVVPSVGISLDAVMSTIRTLLRSTRSRTISGEFITEGNELLLRLRLNGQQIYATKKGTGLIDPDDLLKLAAASVLYELKPYIVATSVKANDPDAALDMIEDITTRLEKTDENVAWAYNLRGGIMEERQDYASAVDALNTALTLNPNLVVAHVNLGLVYVDQGLTEKGIDEYNKALKIEPKYAMAHNNLGSALLTLHKDKEAMAEYKEAIKADSNFALPHQNIANLLRDSGQHDAAMAEYRNAVKVDPDDVGAHDALGIALHAALQDDKAMAEFQEALRLNPKSKFPHYNLGNLLQNLKRNDAAIVEYRKAIEIDPGYTAAHYGLGVALEAVDKDDEAMQEFQKTVTLYRRAIEKNPRNASFHHSLAIALIRVGAPDEAIMEYQKAIVINSGVALYHSNLGLAFSDADRTQDAIAEFEVALQIDAQYAPAHDGLANSLRAAGQLEDAIAEYRKAIAIMPNVPLYHNNLGRTFDQANRKQDAIAEFRAALTIDPSNATAMVELKRLTRKDDFANSVEHPHNRPQQTRRHRARHNRF